MLSLSDLRQDYKRKVETATTLSGENTDFSMQSKMMKACLSEYFTEKFDEEVLRPVSPTVLSAGGLSPKHTIAFRKIRDEN